MKISYVLQLKDFFILFASGVTIGISYGLLNLIPYLKNSKIYQIIADLIISVGSTLVFLLLINVINMGEFRIFLLVGYILGFVLERITLGKLFAKGFQKVYNWIVNKTKKFAISRLGRIVLK
ncbi:MAG: hypothetical protein E7356_01815 [Clostridiales bacterium]|nr:hypothetical protein [Clostridiales bacterium]